MSPERDPFADPDAELNAMKREQQLASGMQEPVDLRPGDPERGRVDGGGVRWETVEVTYVETRTKKVQVQVAASEPLTAADLDANAAYLVDLAVPTDRQRTSAYYVTPSAEFRSARPVRSQVSGGEQS